MYQVFHLYRGTVQQKWKVKGIKKGLILAKKAFKMVGVTGFEPVPPPIINRDALNQLS
jgi:hypothetical protein